MYLQPASLLVLLRAVYYLALYIDDNSDLFVRLIHCLIHQPIKSIGHVHNSDTYINKHWSMLGLHYFNYTSETTYSEHNWWS